MEKIDAVVDQQIEQRIRIEMQHNNGMHPCLYCSTPTDNPKYCSVRCGAIDTNKKYRKCREATPLPIIQCVTCDEPTTNPRYCSRRCSAIDTNKKFPRRKLTNECTQCGKRIRTKQKRCGDCYREKKYIYETLEESINKKQHRSSAYAVVRARARKNVQEWEWAQICKNCGYSKHVEACHIKPIGSFPLETLISEINSKANIVLLCPNCHWEKDHRVSEN